MFEYSIEQFNYDVENVARQIRKSENRYAGIYGIPQGGIPFAVALSAELDLPLVARDELIDFDDNGLEILIVDDLVDSGKTMLTWTAYDKAIIGHKPASPKLGSHTYYAREFPQEWIHFWWEPKEEMDAESLVTRMLEYIGEDPGRPGLVETPKRVVKMWGEVFGGMKDENRPRIQIVPNDDDGVVYDQMLRDSGYFFSHCEHHLVPFFGNYYFGYIPNKSILGASKIGRLIDYYSARPQIAERLVNQVIDDIEKEVKPYGSILVMTARHLCKEMRGLKKWNSPYEAIAVRGSFRENINNCKMEFMNRLPKG